ncbi:hypothetical protein ACLGIH_07825 [Streptomyces sp. HMX87]|uniref:hypothetical protein n=1 Tax=Streptomyces sp. HMX87 TaxID=3390849 RepID=UPI003A850C07
MGRTEAGRDRLPRAAGDPSGARRARRRARAGTTVLLALLLLPPVLCVPPATRPAGVVLGVVAGPVLGLVLFTCGLCEELRPVRHSATRMTARTLTGTRSVDPRRLVDVRLVTAFSYGGADHTLLVRDADGVRLGVTSAAGRRVLRGALGRPPAGAAPRVSGAARAFLGAGPPGRLAAHTVVVFLLETVAICLYVVAVLELGGAV